MSRAGTFCFARPLVFASPLCPLPTLCKLIFRISAGLCANLQSGSLHSPLAVISLHILVQKKSGGRWSSVVLCAKTHASPLVQAPVR